MAKLEILDGQLPCKKDRALVGKEKCTGCESFGEYKTVKMPVDPKDPEKGYEDKDIVVCNRAGPPGVDGQESYDRLCSMFYGIGYEPPSERDDQGTKHDDGPDGEETAREKVRHPHYRGDLPDN